MTHPSFEAQVGGIAALDHPLSQRAYQLVLDEGTVSRDTAAAALGVARSVAAFHLDKLVDAGLLDAGYRRTSGRTGPGAGRPAKIYGRSDREIQVSLPPRRYDLAGSVLAEAVSRAASGALSVTQALATVAREIGQRIGVEAQHEADDRSPRARLMAILGRYGYEPRDTGPEVRLANCPFHRLAEDHRDLICGMNRDLLSGVVDGVGGSNSFDAELAPEPGSCCVRLRSLNGEPECANRSGASTGAGAPERHSE
jgi:predicted ArsR family transcriptional regulator